MSNQLKTFLLGLSVSILILTSFFGGAIADRLFIIKPLDVLTGQVRRSWLPGSTSIGESGLLGDRAATSASVADIAEIASESVVTVAVRHQEAVVGQNAFDPFGLGFFGLPSGQTEEVQRDIGTGFVVNQDGLIVTNRHVVNEAEADYLVIDRYDNEYSVSEIYIDPANDLAILQADDFSGPALPVGDSSQLRVGQEVIAIGTALGEFRHTVTTGVISGLGRGIQAVNGASGFAENLEGVIQTDAAINPGNSGGPLLDRSGRVIGVNAAVSTSAENIGFALPINLVKTSLDNFERTGKFERAFLGIKYSQISEKAALFNEVPAGAYVLEVVADSPAERAGIKVGDILVSFNGQSLKDHDLAVLINQAQIKQRVKINYWRQDKEQTAEVELDQR